MKKSTSFSPVRVIPIQTRSVSGKFPSKKNQRTILYESQIELAMIYHLELAPTVESYTEQPLKVYCSISKTFYIPDFLAVFNNQRLVLIEVKHSHDLKKPKTLKKIKTLIQYASKNEYLFKVVTEKSLLTNLYENYKFLYRFLDKPQHLNFHSDLFGEILTTLKTEISYPASSSQILSFMQKLVLVY